MTDMNIIQRATFRLAQASGGNPITTTLVVALFYIAFQFVEYTVEKIVFGKAFVHILDPVSALIAIGYSAYAVYWCAVFNSARIGQ